MKRIRLRIAYDGTKYCGWQIQNNGISVEWHIREALRTLLGNEIEIIGASRTDAGVHALGNVAVFDTDSRIPPEKFAPALNARLPEDIRVLLSEEVAKDFHPRYCDCSKCYEYTIQVSKIAIPQMTRFSYHVHYMPDVDKMKEAAMLLEGTHDFSAFCSAGAQVKTKVRTLYGVDVEMQNLWKNTDVTAYGMEDTKLLKIRVTGSGFLYNMVRIIAGTLLEVGRGRLTQEDVKEALISGERSKAGPTAPPQGLTLVKIDYEI